MLKCHLHYRFPFPSCYQYLQGMTCDLFWLAALATPQLKIPPHPQPRATCFFDGRNSHPHPQLFNIDFFYYSIISCYQSQISLATYTKVHH